MSDKLSFSTAQSRPAKNRAPSWSEADRKWFKRRHHRSHRVRPRFPNEWFTRPADALDLDLVAAEPAVRTRSPYLERFREAATTDPDLEAFSVDLDARMRDGGFARRAKRSKPATAIQEMRIVVSHD